MNGSPQGKIVKQLQENLAYLISQPTLAPDSTLSSNFREAFLSPADTHFPPTFLMYLELDLRNRNLELPFLVCGETGSGTWDFRICISCDKLKLRIQVFFETC